MTVRFKNLAIHLNYTNYLVLYVAYTYPLLHIIKHFFLFPFFINIEYVTIQRFRWNFQIVKKAILVAQHCDINCCLRPLAQNSLIRSDNRSILY